MEIDSLEPPAWLGLGNQEYRDLLRRKAVAHKRRDQKRGGRYSIKEAMEAIDTAFRAATGIDPYDGLPMDPKLLGHYDNAASQSDGSAYKRRFARLPTIDHIDGKPEATFEIVSWQTNDAKEDMNREEFLDYCRRVVRHADGA
jgi:hypothetical protein